MRWRSPDERVLHDGSVTRWSDVYDLLSASPTARVRAVELTRAGTVAPVMSGIAAELIGAGEAAGAGTSPWAVIATVRPEIQIVDIDRCADRVLQPLLDAADTVGASLAHLTESGSPNSAHLGVTLPSRAARREFARAVAEIRAWAGETTSTVDLRSRNDGLRMPGSASLKPGGGVCWPIDTDGRRITAIEAARRLERALSGPYLDRGQALPSPTAAATTLHALIRADQTDSAIVAPWAYRARTRMTHHDFNKLSVTPRTGLRSHAALAGAWVLWRLGVRSWRAAAKYYDTYPCFAKWRDRDAEDRSRGRHLDPNWVSWSQRHWQAIVRRAYGYRPPSAGQHERQIQAALAEIAHWDDPDLVTAAVAVIRHRFSDGYGLTRPIAVRDLATWLGLSTETARRRLRSLADRGLLTLSKPHDRKSAPREAAVWTLTTPSAVYRTSVSHDVTAGGIRTTLHPTWAALGNHARAVYCSLRPVPTSTEELAAATGIPHGRASHGLLRLLHLLADQGLAVRHGRGRGATWAIGPQALGDCSAAKAGRVTRDARARQIVADRDLWHARGHHAVKVARARVRRLRSLARRGRADSRRATSASTGQLVLSTPVRQPPLVTGMGIRRSTSKNRLRRP